MSYLNLPSLSPDILAPAWLAILKGFARFIFSCCCYFMVAVSAPVVAQIPLQGVSQISTGTEHTCALTSTGGVKCWGRNQAYQLGDSSNLQRNTPVNVVGISNAVAVVTGERHSCALLNTGGVKCWGDNSDGQLGEGTMNPVRVAVQVRDLSTGVIALAAGRFHTCALTGAGGVKCWGSNSYGQLGAASSSIRIPRDVTGLTSGVVQIATGNTHSCALLGNGGVKCWGHNFYGQLGDKTAVDKPTPVSVIGLPAGVNALYSGGSHNCVRTRDGGGKCWGGNYSGQLGNNVAFSWMGVVQPIGLTSGVESFALGADHTCALLTGGALKCWGSNAAGQLGLNSTTGWSVPQDVYPVASGIIAIDAFSYHTCAVFSQGQAKCWGHNTYGQLGNNLTGQSLAPSQVVEFLVPGAPVIGLASPDNTRAIVRFSPPASDGGSPITGYTVVSNPPHGADAHAGTLDSYTGPDELSHLVTGLVNGTSYTFTVRATNTTGTGLASDVSNAVVPSAVGTSSSSGDSSSATSISSANSSSSLANSSTATTNTSSSVSSRASSSAASSVNPCNYYPDSPLNVTIAGALAISDCGAGVRGTGYYTDRYSFIAGSNQMIAIQLNSSAFDTYLYLKTSEGTVIASNDDSNGTTNSRIPAGPSGTYFKIPTYGTYIIEVTSYSTNKTGSYTLLRTAY